MKCITLLRGINVGGNNKIAMSEMKSSSELKGFKNVITYINSGNIMFDSDLDEVKVKAACEELIKEGFGLEIAVGIITTYDLIYALNHATDWWGVDSESKYNAIFAIPPMTALEACRQVGEVKQEYERVAHHGRVIFWSAPLATFSRTLWSKIVQNKDMHGGITIRYANTTKKLAELVRNY